MSVPAVLSALFLIPDLLVQPNNVPGLSSSSTANGLASAFNQLAIDLKSDKLSAAQNAYATVQPDLQSFAPRTAIIIIPLACALPPLLRIFLGNFSPSSAGICSPVI
jgi:hypothetical protein